MKSLSLMESLSPTKSLSQVKSLSPMKSLGTENNPSPNSKHRRVPNKTNLVSGKRSNKYCVVCPMIRADYCGKNFAISHNSVHLSSGDPNHQMNKSAGK
jgi:hypothetical protein